MGAWKIKFFCRRTLHSRKISVLGGYFGFWSGEGECRETAGSKEKQGEKDKDTEKDDAQNAAKTDFVAVFVGHFSLSPCETIENFKILKFFNLWALRGV